jgi:hypothetical protein
MWHSFLALPLVIRIIAWAGGPVIALCLVIKRKAIHAVVKNATEAASKWFWKWVRKKAALGRPQDGNEKTYKGIYQDYGYRSIPGPMHYFCVTHDGVTTTVRVLNTDLLYGLKIGSFVEIDTESRPGSDYEIIKRVHVHDTSKAGCP